MPAPRLAATAAVALAGLLIATPAVADETTAGSFLERELRAGNNVFDYPGTDQPDLGVTIDGILGMIASGVGPGEARSAATSLEASVDDYLGPTFGKTELYAGPVAKTAILAAAIDENPRSFGGHDLITELAGLQDKDGRYADRTAYTDTSNVFTQGLALVALSRAGADPSTKAVDFLLAQQCSDGGFRMFIDKSKCVSDPDSTSMAVSGLLAADTGSAAADRGLDYLAGRMLPTGGMPGGVGATSANANSTGLAASVFAEADRKTQLADTQGFLRSLQFSCTAPVAIRGGIAYDLGAYVDLIAEGSGATPDDQLRRATSQAALGLAGVALSEVTIDSAREVTDACADGTSTSPPSSPTSPPSSPTSPAGSGGGSSTTPVSTLPSATSTAPGVIPPPGGPGQPPAPSSTTSSGSTPGLDATSTGPVTTSATSQVPQVGSATAAIAPTAVGTAADPTATSGSSPRSVVLPAALGSGLVLLGAASFALYRRQGRHH